MDMDAFYASVEVRQDPSLKGKPIVVGGSPEGRGVVCSASYEARKFGIRSAMSCRRAYALCPQAIFVPPHFTLYKEASQQIREIFLSVTDLVEPLALDEAYLDVTENKLGEPLASRIAVHLRHRIRSELGLTASAGVGPSKFVAKGASDLRKPDGLVVIPPEKVDEFVAALPVERLWGVGPATAKKLHQLGLKKAGDIRLVAPVVLEKAFGKFGHFLHGLSFGRDPRRVNPNREPKSRGSEVTFDRDVKNLALLEKTVSELAQDVAASLEKLQRQGRTVTLKVRYHDFSTITRSRTSPQPLIRAAEISARTPALQLLHQGTEAGRRPMIRLLGISVSQFVSEEVSNQLNLDL